MVRMVARGEILDTTLKSSSTDSIHNCPHISSLVVLAHENSGRPFQPRLGVCEVLLALAYLHDEPSS